MLRRLVPFLLAAPLFLAGCDASVDPFVETDRYFTLFGTFDMALDTQFVRVTPVRPVLEPGDPRPFSGAVTSTDLTTGLQHTWRDSLVSFSDGATGHIFYTPLRIQPGHTYRLDVTRGDSASSAQSTVPDRPSPIVEPPELSGGFVGAEFATGSQTIQWTKLEKAPHRVEVWYRFLSVFDTSPSGPGFVDIMIPGIPNSEPIPGGWAFSLDLDENRRALDTLVLIDETPLIGVGMRLTLLDEAFVPPGGVFDRELQEQPGAFSNVENGFGFVGSVGRFSVEWILSNEAATRLDYVTLERLYGKARAAQIRRQLAQEVAAIE